MRSKSLKKQGAHLMITLAVFFAILLLCLSYVFLSSNKVQHRKDLQVRADQYAELLHRDIRQATTQIEQYFSESANYKKITSGKTLDYEWAKSVYYIKKDLTAQAASLPFSGGVFFYDRYRDRFFSSYNNYTQSIQELNALLKQAAKDDFKSRLYYGYDHFQGNAFLVYYLGVNNNPIGYVLSLTDYYQAEDGMQVALGLVDLANDDKPCTLLASFGSDLLLADEMIQCLQADETESMIRSNLIHMEDISAFPGLRLITVSDTSKYSLWHQQEFWYLILFLIGAFLFVHMFFTRMLKRTLLKPVTHLHERLTQIRQGGNAALTVIPEDIEEYRAINDQIDNMTQQINEYREKQLKEQLRTNEALLQYYQLQTNPHFFLSCLNTVSSLLDIGKLDVANKLIHALSAQFRYFFRASMTLVPLHEEIASARNYCDISSIRTGHPILLSCEIADEARDFDVPLLSVMTFVENAIKHFGHPGRILTIRIQAHVHMTDGERSLELSIMDNGKGYPPGMLEELNQSVDSYNFVPNHVGIRNLKYRIRLLYDDRASWYFYNSPFGSAVAELTLTEANHDRSDS